jgi:Tol biopolymer transport system component
MSKSGAHNLAHIRRYGVLVIEAGNSIYTVRADGSNNKLLTAPGFMPSWTPDGRIIFTSPRGGSPQIWIMDADGSNLKQLSQLTNQGVPAMPQMGLNGLVVFKEVRSQWEDNSAIWVMRRDGSGLLQVARGQQPSFARSGKWLSYTYETDNLYHRQIWRVNADGTGKQQLTFLGDPNYPDANASNISPDEKWIAFFSGKESDKGPAGLTQDPATWGHRNVAIMPANGGARITLTRCMPFQKRRGDECVAADNPAWSPDGQWILYDTDKDGIWVIDINGQHEQQLYSTRRGTVRVPLRYD